MRKTNLTLRTSATKFDTGRHRGVVVHWDASQPDLLTFRLEGTRRRYPLDCAALYDRALKNHLEHERREKKRRKGAK